MPCLDNDLLVLQNQVPNLVEFTSAEPMIPREFDGCQPELAVLPIASNVDVHGLVAVEAIEKEPVGPKELPNPANVPQPRRLRMAPDGGGCSGR